MRNHLTWMTLLSALAAAGTALADQPQPAVQKPSTAPKAESSHAAAPGQATADKKAYLRQCRDEREKMVRERGEIFARIATKHDYSGEYVLYRDQEVTAFLDLKDPRHPRYSPEAGHDEGTDGRSKRQAHLLVVPNQPRESIGKTLASDITADDLQTTLKVMQAATSIAKRFGIKSPKIFVKSPGRVGVGYLHVHILGERDPNVAYPPALK